MGMAFKIDAFYPLFDLDYRCNITSKNLTNEDNKMFSQPHVEDVLHDYEVLDKLKTLMSKAIIYKDLGYSINMDNNPDLICKLELLFCEIANILLSTDASRCKGYKVTPNTLIYNLSVDFNERHYEFLFQGICSYACLDNAPIQLFNNHIYYLSKFDT